MPIEQILRLDRAPDDQLAKAQETFSEAACRLCEEGIESEAIAIAALQVVVFALVKTEGQLATADILNGLAYELRSEPSNHLGDMEVRGEA